jgi:toxin YhaV
MPYAARSNCRSARRCDPFLQQYRLLFRYHSESRIIIYAWVNDEDTRRAYERDSDADRTFRRMLKGGNPPDDWNELLGHAKTQNKRMRAAKDGAR